MDTKGLPHFWDSVVMNVKEPFPSSSGWRGLAGSTAARHWSGEGVATPRKKQWVSGSMHFLSQSWKLDLADQETRALELPSPLSTLSPCDSWCVVIVSHPHPTSSSLPSWEMSSSFLNVEARACASQKSWTFLSSVLVFKAVGASLGGEGKTPLLGLAAHFPQPLADSAGILISSSPGRQVSLHGLQLIISYKSLTNAEKNARHDYMWF